MKRNNFIVIISLALVALIAIIIFVQWGSSTNTPSISVPSPSASAQESDSINTSALLDIDADSVQALIASIERPDSYSRKYRVRTFWDGGESEAEITVYCNGEQYRIIHRLNGKETNILFSDGKRHTWYDDPNDVSTVDIDTLDKNSLDLYARLIVFEELLDVPKEDILGASSEVILNEICISVEYRHSDTYVYRLYVSIKKGLLVAAEALENGKTVYLLEADSPDISIPKDEMFMLPG